MFFFKVVLFLLKSADLLVLAVQVRPPAPSNFKGLAPKGLSLLYSRIDFGNILETFVLQSKGSQRIIISGLIGTIITHIPK
jgi:hypothetical protein